MIYDKGITVHSGRKKYYEPKIIKSEPVIPKVKEVKRDNSGKLVFVKVKVDPDIEAFEKYKPLTFEEEFEIWERQLEDRLNVGIKPNFLERFLAYIGLFGR